MHAIRQKCRPKHQVLVLKCYPRTTKGAVDVKPNSSELSYLLYYATTRRSKVQKVGAFLEKKTASDVWRARIGNVQVTLQILTALIEKAPRDLPLYAPYVLKILNIILRSSDITMVESSIITFESFCENHDGASLSADQGYLHQYEEIVHIYASFASTRPLPSKVPLSAPVAMRWRSVGLRAIKSVASAEALASVAGRQLNVTVPILLENLWTDNDDFLDLLEHRMKMEEKVDAEKSLTRRRTSIATVRTMENSADSTIMAVSGTTADADKLAEEDTGVLALQCLKGIFDVNNRLQIHGATQAFLKFVSERVAQNEPVTAADTKDGRCRGWGTRVFEMIAGWAPVQDRYVILVTAMDTLVRSPLVEANLKQQYVLATMIDSLLKSDINLIGLSVMDVLLGLIQHVLRALQLDGAAPHLQQNDVTGVKNVPGNPHSSSGPPGAIGEASIMASDVRKHLLTRLQECIGDLATHVYYTDQISDMVSALLLRLKPSPFSGVPNAAAAIENPAAAAAAITEVGDMTEDQNTDGFFSFDTAKIKALEAIKSILIVASHRKSMSGVGNLGRSRVPVKVWEGTQWLLRDLNGGVRKAYVDALLSWLDLELIKSDLRISNDKHTRTARDELPQNLSKRAVSNASHKEKPSKSSRTTFLQLLHLAVYENALQYLDSEPDIVLLHLLLTNLVENLGINAVKDGLPMIFRLQEEILELETPMAKIRIGSLCHGYFWALSEQFNFDSSPTGRVIHNEIRRRRSKKFWIDRIRLPALRIDQIGMPGQLMPQQALPLEEVESESLIPFDDRFQMVKLIALSYAQSVASPPPSAPSSPGRNFTHPILSADGPFMQNHHTMPEWIRDQMMSEWSRESVIAVVKESSKTVSLNGSRAGTNTTGHRNFLAVNGNLANREGTSSGQASPQSLHYPHHTHRSRPNSTYGLVGGLGVLQKLRVGHSSSPASESEHQSVTRVDQLKRILSGQQAASSGPIAITHSDASSESMVSYDFTASEVSFNQSPQFGPLMERSVSLREPRDRSRSKSRDRNGANELSRPLTSHPVLAHSNGNGLTEKEALDSVPPVPPLPSSLAHESVASQDYALKDTLRKGRSAKRNTNSRGQQSSSTAWGEEGAAIDLETLLKGIVTNGEEKGYFAKPPY